MRGTLCGGLAELHNEEKGTCDEKLVRVFWFGLLRDGLGGSNYTGTASDHAASGGRGV